MSPLLLPLAVFLSTDLPAVTPMVDLREVRYYDARFYAGSDPPFTLSAPQVLPRSEITEDRIDATLLGRNLVIEVCVFVRDAPDAPWRTPSNLRERERSCETHGTYEAERRP